MSDDNGFRTAARSARTAAVLLAALAGASAPLGAQRLAERVRAAGDATVRMSFASRPDVCGTRGGISMHRDDGRTHIGDWSSGRDWDSDCDYGPVRVSLLVRDGRVSAVRTHVGGRWRSSDDAVDLGMVPAAEAAEYLLDLAQRSDGRAARDAILPAVLADSATVWPALLRIARDQSRPRDARRQAVFWLGQAAGDSAAARLEPLAADDEADREVREAAIFALSQRPRHEGIPALVRVARTSRDPELRRKAIFWLGQSNDPRAVDLIEEILMGRRP